MESPELKINKNKRKSVKFGNFHVTSVKVNKKNITIEFPKKVANYLNLNGNSNQLYWTVVDGVVQLSSDVPHMVIPMINVNVEKFIPQNS